MEEPDYWKRLARRRLARRRFLTGAAAVGAGLAAVSVVGCGGGGEDNGPTGTASSTAAATPSPEGADPFATLPAMGPRGPWQPAKTRGGIARWFGFDWVAPSQPSTRWPYLGNRRMTPWFGDWYLYPPNLWLDSKHPTFQDRPA